MSSLRASRQLRRKVPYAGHLMTPRRLWLNKIPTQCDVVIEFPEDAPDEALRWLLARIRSQPPAGLGLVVQVKAHESSRRNAFYISAPTNILFRAAEEARLPKRLRPDLGGALREFTTRESHCFQQIKSDDGNTALFTSQERQWLVLQVLQGLRAGQSDIEALQGRAALEEGQSIVAAWQETGLITQVFPLHETKSLASLQKSWVKQVLAPQPLDDIAEYFGVKVALYFAWLGHYTCALGVPAVFGTILYAFLWGKNQMAQDMGHVLFSLFNVAWASLYLEAWKRYSVELAFRWGTLSTPPELLEPPRPLYKGPLVENNVTGRLEPKEAPAWKRRAFRYLVSFPIIGLCLLLVFVVMFLMLRFQDWLDNNNFPDRGITQCMYNLHKDWWDSKLPESGVLCCLSVIPKVLLAGAITLMDEAYYKLAVWLNDKENYRLQSKYENHLIAKVALFQFVNSFLSLFYIAFYLRDEEKLKEQLAGLLISRQIIGNLRESAIPYVAEQVRLAKLSFNMWGALSPTQDNNRSFADTVMAAKAAAAAVSPTSVSSESEKTKQPSGTSTPQPGTPSKQLPKKSSTDTGCSTPTTTASATRRNIGQAEIESSLYKVIGIQVISRACKSCKTKKKIPEIPPFHGYSVRNLSSIPIQRLHALTGASASSLALNTRQCMNLPEIPPFRKKSTDSADHTGSSASSSPQRTTANSNLINASASVSASRQHLPQQSQPIVVAAANVNTATSASASSSNAHHQQQLQQQQSSLTSSSNEKKPLPTISKISDIPPFNARKISAESTMNLNITELKSHSDTMDVLKPAPSWTNVAMKTSTSQQQQAQHQQPPPQSSSLSAASPGASQQTQVIASSSSSSSGGASTTRAEFSRPSVGAISTTSTTSQQQQKDTQSSSTQQNDKEQASTSATQQAAKASTSGGNTTDEEAKAAELAAKKNRLKQKLVKSARSVAIFSLKLKERRQREAEKAATIAIEHAKALAKLPPLPQPGGELSLIPIEQLIQIEDIKPLLKPATSSSTSAASNSSSAATASNNTNNTMSTTTPSAALLAAAAAAHAQQSQQQQNNQPPGSSSSGGY
uniref:Anoctamin n=1 Tax=Stomoxys calcitrans TaxID=35570 RepID=A0A1I8PCQ7_STOCA